MGWILQKIFLNNSTFSSIHIEIFDRSDTGEVLSLRWTRVRFLGLGSECRARFSGGMDCNLVNLDHDPRHWPYLWDFSAEALERTTSSVAALTSPISLPICPLSFSILNNQRIKNIPAFLLIFLADFLFC